MIIAIDTGGTKTLLAGFSKEGKVLKSFEFETPKSKSKYLEIIEKITKLKQFLAPNRESFKMKLSHGQKI